MDDLTRRFAYHPPQSEAIKRNHEEVRTTCDAAAANLIALLPAEAGREKATMLTKLEEAMMWANAGIARWQ